MNNRSNNIYIKKLSVFCCCSLNISGELKMHFCLHDENIWTHLLVLTSERTRTPKEQLGFIFTRFLGLVVKSGDSASTCETLSSL